MQVNILEAKNQLSRLVKSARTGEDVVIAHRGVPVARLVRADGAPGDTASGQPVGIVAWLKQNPLPEHLRRSPQAIEQALGEERDGWD